MAKKMTFTEDKFYNDECLYLAGKVYEIPDDKYTRWLNRGGIPVEEKVETAPVKEETVKAEPVAFKKTVKPGEAKKADDKKQQATDQEL